MGESSPVNQVQIRSHIQILQTQVFREWLCPDIAQRQVNVDRDSEPREGDISPDADTFRRTDALRPGSIGMSAAINGFHLKGFQFPGS